MSIQGTKNQTTNGFFSKGYYANGDTVYAKNNGLINKGLSEIAENCVVKGGLMYKRNGYSLLNSLGTGKVRAIGTRKDELVVVHGDLIKVSSNGGTTFASIGSLTGDTDSRPSILTNGDYTLIVNKGQTSPQLYDGTTLRSLTTSADITSEWKDGLTITSEPKISYMDNLNGAIITFGDIFLVSNAISFENPEYFFDFNYLDSITGILFDDSIGNIDALGTTHVFTKSGIQLINLITDREKNIALPKSNSFDESVVLGGRDAVTSIGNKVVFLSDDKRIMTIGFKEGIENTQLGELSLPIKDDLIEILHDDQSKSIVTYSSQSNLVKIICRSKGNISGDSDIIIAYDLIEDTFYKHIYDDEITSAIRLGKKTIFTTSNGLILQDESGDSDNGEKIDFKVEKGDISIGSISRKSLIRGIIVTGLIDDDNIIDLELICDGISVATRKVDTRVVETYGITRDGLKRRTKVFSVGSIWKECKYINLISTCSSDTGKFALGNVEIIYTDIEETKQFTKKEKF